MSPTPKSHPAAACAGFTLLELLVVMGVLSILAGIGIGFVADRDDALAVTRGILRSQLRLCYETARNEGRPTELLLQKFGEESPSYLRAKVLDLVGQWHLEPGERAFAGLDPVVYGQPEPAGRYGSCLRHDETRDNDMFAFDAKDVPRFDLAEGFSLSLEVFFEARRKCSLVVLDKTLSLEFDAELRPRATLTLRDEGGGRGPGVRLELLPPELVMPLQRWLSLELSYERRALRLLVDGEVVATAPGKGLVYQPPEGQQLRVSLAQSPVAGKIDEIRLLGYFFDEPQEIPAGVRIEGFGEGIGFDRLGRLRRPVSLTIHNGPETERREIGPGGILR